MKTASTISRWPHWSCQAPSHRLRTERKQQRNSSVCAVPEVDRCDKARVNLSCVGRSQDTSIKWRQLSHHGFALSSKCMKSSTLAISRSTSRGGNGCTCVISECYGYTLFLSYYNSLYAIHVCIHCVCQCSINEHTTTATTLPAMPKACREITSCGFAKACLSQRCSCRKLRTESIEVPQKDWQKPSEDSPLQGTSHYAHLSVPEWRAALCRPITTWEQAWHIENKLVETDTFSANMSFKSFLAFYFKNEYMYVIRFLIYENLQKSYPLTQKANRVSLCYTRYLCTFLTGALL